MYKPVKDDITYRVENINKTEFTIVMSFDLKKFGASYAGFLKKRVPYHLDNVLSYFIKITDDCILVYSAGRDKIEDVPKRVKGMIDDLLKLLDEIYEWMKNLNDDCVCAVQNDIIKFPKDSVAAKDE